MKEKILKSIIRKVKQLKEDSTAIPIGSEKEDAEKAPWTNYFHSMHP